MEPHVKELLVEIGSSEGLGEDCRVEVTGGVPDGSNFHGKIARVTLTGKGDRRLKVIVKTPSGEEEATRKLQRMDEKFKNEVTFYERIAPRLEGVRTAKYYSSSLEPGKQVIVLGELEGYRMVDTATGLDLAHCKAVLEYLARLHANPVPPGAPLEEAFFFRGFDPASMAVLRAFTDKNCADALAYAGDAYKERVARFNEGLLEELFASVEGGRSTRPVVTHGDSWNNNYLFKYDAQGGVEDVVLVDWQMCRAGSGLQDVWQCLACSTAAPRVLASWPALVRHYAALRPRVDLDDRLSFEFGLGMSLYILPFVCKEPMVGDDFDRMVSAVRASAEVSYAGSEDAARKRMRDVIGAAFDAAAELGVSLSRG